MHFLHFPAQKRICCMAAVYIQLSPSFMLAQNKNKYSKQKLSNRNKNTAKQTNRISATIDRTNL